MKPVYVRGYTRSNGKYVAPYHRSLPSPRQKGNSTSGTSLSSASERGSYVAPYNISLPSPRIRSDTIRSSANERWSYGRYIASSSYNRSLPSAPRLRDHNNPCSANGRGSSHDSGCGMLCFLLMTLFVLYHLFPLSLMLAFIILIIVYCCFNYNVMYT